MHRWQNVDGEHLVAGEAIKKKRGGGQIKAAPGTAGVMRISEVGR